MDKKNGGKVISGKQPCRIYTVQQKVKILENQVRVIGVIQLYYYIIPSQLEDIHIVHKWPDVQFQGSKDSDQFTLGVIKHSLYLQYKCDFYGILAFTFKQKKALSDLLYRILIEERLIFLSWLQFNPADLTPAEGPCGIQFLTPLLLFEAVIAVIQSEWNP